jgi:hypothetical protein
VYVLLIFIFNSVRIGLVDLYFFIFYICCFKFSVCFVNFYFIFVVLNLVFVLLIFIFNGVRIELVDFFFKVVSGI